MSSGVVQASGWPNRGWAGHGAPAVLRRDGWSVLFGSALWKPGPGGTRRAASAGHHPWRAPTSGPDEPPRAADQRADLGPSPRGRRRPGKKQAADRGRRVTGRPRCTGRTGVERLTTCAPAWQRERRRTHLAGGPVRRGRRSARFGPGAGEALVWWCPRKMGDTPSRGQARRLRAGVSGPGTPAEHEPS